MADSSITLYVGDSLTITVSDGQAPEPAADPAATDPAVSFDPTPPGVDPVTDPAAPDPGPPAGSVPSPIASEGNPPDAPDTRGA